MLVFLTHDAGLVYKSCTQTSLFPLEHLRSFGHHLISQCNKVWQTNPPPASPCERAYEFMLACHSSVYISCFALMCAKDLERAVSSPAHPIATDDPSGQSCPRFWNQSTTHVCACAWHAAASHKQICEESWQTAQGVGYHCNEGGSRPHR